MSNKCTPECTIGLAHCQSTGSNQSSTGASHGVFHFLRNSIIAKQILASSIGSAVAVIALNPINVVKVSLQSSSSQQKFAVDAMKEIINRKGVWSLWSGTSMGLLQALPNTAIYMTAYERAKVEVSALPFGNGLAGAMARFYAVSIMSPLELIRTLQLGGSEGSGFAIANRIIQQRGMIGLYRGWSNSILRDVPFSAIYWFSYEYLRVRYGSLFEYLAKGQTGREQIQNPNHMITFLAGASAGIAAAFVTHPFDVLKTQNQLISLLPADNTIVSTGERTKLTVSDNIGFSSLYKQGGIRSLFTGMTLRLMTVIPSSAIMVTIYEAVKTASD